MYKFKHKALLSLALLACSAMTNAQDKIVFPDITYAGSPRDVVIGGINVSGMSGYEDTCSPEFPD